MHYPRLLSVAAVAMALSACTNLVRPNFTNELITLHAGQYTLDPQHSFLIFKVNHLGLSKIVGRFNSLSASLDFDPENLAGLQLNGLIDPASIDLNNNDLEETLQDSSWFDTAQYPQISFVSTNVNASQGNPQSKDQSKQLIIEGNLSIRGVAQAVSLSATFNGGADNILTRKYTIGFSAATKINRSDFGMDTFDAFIGDEIEVELHGEFQRQ